MQDITLIFQTALHTYGIVESNCSQSGSLTDKRNKFSKSKNVDPKFTWKLLGIPQFIETKIVCICISDLLCVDA
jgi:hypothetical protein